MNQTSANSKPPATTTKNYRDAGRKCYNKYICSKMHVTKEHQ